MKRLLFGLSFVMLTGSAFAQFDEAKNMVLINQNKKALETLNQLMAKPKNAGKPEGYILKATILSNLIGESQDEAEKDKLLAESLEAYKKYQELDPKKEFVAQPPYSNPPITYYSTYFNKGIKGYNKKDWPAAAADFGTTVFWSDYIIENKLAKMEFDTSANLLAGAAYQNAKMDDEAVKYFTRMTDRKIGGEDNEFVYQFLMGYYFRKDDMAGFEKYKALGKELYPKSEYFTYTEMDFIMAMEDEAEKMKRIEAKLAKDPSNIELTENYGYLLFDKLNGADDAPVPANASELEGKMVTYLSKAGDAKPTDGKPYYFLGNHYINKAVKVNQEIGKVTDEIRKANANAKPDKSGKLPPPPKELTDKREQLKKAYDAEVDKGLPYLIKSANAYGANTNLTGMEKQNYKKLVDQLILIYGDKKAATKDPKLKAEYEKEEKKWNDLYSKISH
jgi:hypothetical protein